MSQNHRLELMGQVPLERNMNIVVNGPFSVCNLHTESTIYGNVGITLLRHLSHFAILVVKGIRHITTPPEVLCKIVTISHCSSLCRKEGRGRRRSLLAAWREERQISPPLSRKSAYQPLIHVYTDTVGRLISCFLGLRLPFPSSQSYRDTNRGAIIAQNSLPFSLDRKFNL